MLTLCGCTSHVDADSQAKRQCSQIMELFSNNYTDGIKAMFCTAVSGSDGFEDDLREAVEFFEGEVSSYDIKAIGSDEKSEKGRQVYVHISPKIRDIKTNSGKTYKLSYYSYLVDSEHEEFVGISEIVIENDDGSSFTLGDYQLVDP